MNDPDLLKLRQISFLSRKFPDEWQNLTENFDDIELSDLNDWLEKYAKYISLDTSEIFDIYEMIKANLENLNNGIAITADNIKYPQYKNYRVNWSQDYTEYGNEYGSNRYLGSDKNSVDKQIQYDMYNADFDYDTSDVEVAGRDSDNFQYDVVEEELKKTIHNVLKEHYKLFINKKN